MNSKDKPCMLRNFFPTTLFQGDFHWKCPWKILKGFSPVFPKKKQPRKFPLEIPKAKIPPATKIRLRFPLEMSKVNLEKKIQRNFFQLSKAIFKSILECSPYREMVHKRFRTTKTRQILKKCHVPGQGRIWLPNEENSWNLGKTRRRAWRQVADWRTHGRGHEILQVPRFGRLIFWRCKCLWVVFHVFSSWPLASKNSGEIYACSCISGSTSRVEPLREQVYPGTAKKGKVPKNYGFRLVFGHAY